VLDRVDQWGIISGTQECPDLATNADKHTKYVVLGFVSSGTHLLISLWVTFEVSEFRPSSVSVTGLK